MDGNGRSQHGGAASLRNLGQLSDDLGTLAALGQGDNSWHLRLEELSFLVRLHAEEHCKQSRVIVRGGEKASDVILTLNVGLQTV
jgi:hypothetical protein